MNVLIVEDEILSSDYLILLLTRIDPTIKVVKQTDSVAETIAFFATNPDIDLVFMDIHLSDANCFEIFKQVDIQVPIIFTTAYDNFAIQAFKQNSIDYLLKPISKNDLEFALNKFKKLNKVIESNPKNEIFDFNTQSYKSNFIIKIGTSIETINTTEIHHFETEDSFSFLVTNAKKRFIINYSLDQLETKLDPKYYFRINRKVIIQKKSIEKINTFLNHRLIISTQFLSDEEMRIVSRERVKDFKKWYWDLGFNTD